MRVVFTPRAERHIDELHRYITEASGYESRADAYVARIVDYCLSLGGVPFRGISRDDILPGLRVVGFERRVSIAFTVETDLILIEGVFYGGQNFESTFQN